MSENFLIENDENFVVYVFVVFIVFVSNIVFVWTWYGSISPSREGG